MPISRFLNELVQQGNHERYMQLLVGKFNPETMSSLMCRNLLSVS